MTMTIVVLGASGRIGRRISRNLEERGHTVTPAHRGAGVDLISGEGLAAAMEGADAIVDASDPGTVSGKEAARFFTTAGRNVVNAAEAAGVDRIVCVSIYGAADPRVNRRFPYYRAKAAQEALYQRSPIPSTTIHSTQWFELIDMFASSAVIGPIGVLPTMRIAPLAADGAAAAIADAAVDRYDGDATVTIRGRDEMSLLQAAREVLKVRGTVGGKHPRLLAQLPYLGRGIARGGLIPAHADVVVPSDLARWARSKS